MPFHPQEAHHCGPASLLTVLESSGVETDYPTVASRVFVPGLEGSLQAEMTAAIRQFGRIAYSLPGSPEALLAEVQGGRPVLVLLNLGLPSRPYWHYAVVVGFDPSTNRIVLRSGTERRVEQKARAWLRRWDWAGRWAIVLLGPDEWPRDPVRDRLLDALADFEETAAPELAGRAWRNAASHWPGEATVWLGVGNSAHALGEWAPASAAYRQVLELDPGHLPARLNLASTLLEAGAPCRARTELGRPPPADHALRAVFDSLAANLDAACEG